MIVDRDRFPIVKAKLPHPLVQNAIFAACKGGVEEPLVNPDHGEDRSVVFKTVNAAGDVMLVVSPRRLKTNPDMGVFLAGVALAQKYMPTQTEEDWKNVKINVRFPVREFYDLVAPGDLRPRASKNRLWFEESLCTLAKTRVSVTFGDPGIGKHGGNLRYQMQSSLWDYKFCPLRGRSGGTIVLSILSDFVPRDYYVWADAALCNRLESQVSREIFWQLIGRELSVMMVKPTKVFLMPHFFRLFRIPPFILRQPMVICNMRLSRRFIIQTVLRPCAIRAVRRLLLMPI